MPPRSAHPPFLLIVPVLLGAGTLVSCKNDLDAVAAVEVPEAAPDRTTLQAEYRFTEHGVLKNILRAGRIDEFTGRQPEHTEIGDGLELLFFDTSGAEGSRLTARRGSLLPAEQRMKVMEEVVFTNAKGEKLETELLIWSQDSDRVYTDKPVKITRQEDIIFGTGLDAAEDLSRYTIRKITGTLSIPEEAGTTDAAAPPQ